MLYSVVRTVVPGTPCSHLPGESEVDFTDNRDAAYARAADYNRCVGIAGITYRVMELESDEHPDRIPTDEMRYDREQTR